MQDLSAHKVLERHASSSTVRVVRHDEYDGQSSWIVTVRGSSNIVRLRRFNSLHEALGFAAKTFAGCLLDEDVLHAP